MKCQGILALICLVTISFIIHIDFAYSQVSILPERRSLEQFQRNRFGQSVTPRDHYRFPQQNSQSSSSVYNHIGELLEGKRYDELLSFLSIAPSGLAPWEVYLFRIRALYALEKYDLALRQAEVGVRSVQKLYDATSYESEVQKHKDPNYFSYFLLRMFYGEFLLLTGHFEKSRQELDTISELFSADYVASKGGSERLQRLKLGNDRVKGFDFDIKPLVDYDNNISGAPEAYELDNLASINRPTDAAAQPSPGWNLGIRLFAAFSHYFNPQEYFATSMLFKVNFARGAAFSDLKTQDRDTYESLLRFIYQKPVSKNYSLAPSLTIARTNSLTAEASTPLTFELPIIHYLSGRTRLTFTPSLGTTLYDNANIGPNILYGLTSEILWVLPTFAGSFPSLRFATSYSRSWFIDSKSVFPNVHVFSLTNRLGVHPKDFLNVRLEFSPSVSIRLYDSPNTIPNSGGSDTTFARRDISIGASVVATFYGFRLIPGVDIYPQITMIGSRIFSTVPINNSRNLSLFFEVDYNF